MRVRVLYTRFTWGLWSIYYVSILNQKFWKFSEKILPFNCVSARCSTDQKKREERLRQRSDKRNKGGLGDLLNDKQSLRVDWTMQVCTYNTYLCHFVFVCYCSWFTVMSSFTNFAFDWACFLDLGWIVVQNDNYIIHVTVFHYMKYQLHYRMWCQTLQKC